MKPVWFKAQRHIASKGGGWGLTPCTWQGWLTIVLFFVLVAVSLKGIGFTLPSGKEVFIGSGPLIGIYICIVIVIIYLTAESGWRHGGK